VGWYAETAPTPYIYRHTVPIWSDPNLEELSRYIQTGCALANVRSATTGQAVQLSNCQPFRFGQLLGIHNGFIANFRETLYRPIRAQLGDETYRLIQGTTDSEHIFALFCQHRLDFPEASLAESLRATLQQILTLVMAIPGRVGLNLIITDGQQLVASRCAYPDAPPSLYWLRAEPTFSESVLVASEPIFASDDWQKCPANCLIVVGANLDVHVSAL
jgi:glutamine amidotransferase